MWKKSLNKLLCSIKNTIKTRNEFRQFVAPRKKILSLALLSSIGYTFFGILEPWPLKILFDSLFYSEPLPPFLSPLNAFPQSSLLWVLVVAIILIALFRGMFYYYQQLLVARSGQLIASDVRGALFQHLQSLPMKFHDKKASGDLMARLTNDIRMLREALVPLPLSLFGDLVLLSAMFIVMALINIQITLLCLLAFPLLMLLIKKYNAPMREAIREQRDQESSLSSMAVETLRSIKAVQGFQQEEKELLKFSKSNVGSLKTGLKSSRLEAEFKWASEISIAVISSMMIWVAAHAVMAGKMTPGDLLVFSAYLRAFFRPLKRLSKYTGQFAKGFTSGQRIFEIITTQNPITDKPGALEAGLLQGEITFDNVSLVYQGKKGALKQVSMSIAPGERVALLGPTGSGKSSLVNLLMRFWDPTEGTVLIDGQDIRNFTLASLRKNIAFVFQEPFLFRATVLENIGYGKPGASREMIIDACRKTAILDILEELEEGLDTMIEEGGKNLSGGQRQCIAIARAALKEAPILILDEPTSNIDKLQSVAIMRALLLLMENKTCILITHQKEILPGIERIITLKRGSVLTKSSEEQQPVLLTAPS